MRIAGALIEWEAANPQELEAEELMKRLVFTYSAALACFRHYPVRGTDRFGLTIEMMAIVTCWDWRLICALDPFSSATLTERVRFVQEMWHGMAAACTAAEQPDEARSVYKRAIEALPDALLLTFAYADFEATQGKSAAATEAFEALLVRFPRQLSCLPS